MMHRKSLAEAEDAQGERGYWWNWWQVYGLGEIGSLQGVCIQGWHECEAIPLNAKYLCTGLDFGYTNDPTAAVDMYEMDGQIYLDEVLYKNGLSNREIFNHLKSAHRFVVADSSEPKSIDEIYSYGLNITAAKKGADSVAFGIQLMNERPPMVTKRSANLLNELRNYTWMTDREGKAMNKPIDAYNHACDASRYAYIYNSSDNFTPIAF
jgi:phage terminase large subunit